MKSVHNYLARFTIEEEIKNGVTFYTDNKKDTLAQQLEKICFKKPIVLSSTQTEIVQFEWFSNALYWIQITKEKGRDKSKEYERKVSIETMPPQSVLPKELSDVLERLGYHIT